MRRAAAGLALAALCLAGPAGADPVDTTNTKHVDLGPGMEGWLYLDREDVSITRMRIAPGAHEAPHLHRKARLFFTALNGTLIIEIGETTHFVAAGQGIEVPPGTVHRAGNAGAEPLELMVVAMPPSAGDRETVEQE